VGRVNTNRDLSFTETLSTAASFRQTYESAEMSRGSCGVQESDNKIAQYLNKITEPMGSLQAGNLFQIILLAKGKNKKLLLSTLIGRNVTKKTT
jgi:hypothetical protein